MVAGAGFYTDAYDIFADNFANLMIGYVYFPESGILSTADDTAIKIATSGGTILGQILFGFLGDYLGRKKVFSFNCHSNNYVGLWDRAYHYHVCHTWAFSLCFEPFNQCRWLDGILAGDFGHWSWWRLPNLIHHY